MPNPYVVYDKRQPHVPIPQVVYSRYLAIGYAPSSQLAISDATVCYNLHTYDVSDAMNRIKKYPRFGKLMYKDQIDPANRGYFIPDPDENFGIWLDVTAPAQNNKLGVTEFYCWLQERQRRQQYADRFAQGYAKRNALKSHPAIGITRVQLETGGVCGVPVMAWRREVISEKMIMDAAMGRGGNVQVVSSNTSTEELIAEQSEETGEIMDDMAERNETVADILGATKVRAQKPEPAPEPPKEQKSPREVAMDKIQALRQKMGEKSWGKFWSETVTSGKTIDQFSDKQIVKFEEVLDRHCFKEGIE